MLRHDPRSWLVGAVVAIGLVSCGGRSRTVDVQILAFNDFHGRLEPPAGSTGRIGDMAAGGIEFFATHLARLRATNPNTLVVSAGDNVGATPFLSGLFHDEPTIEALNVLGLDVSAVGNHELDEGWWELLRLQHGGCHPSDGCQDETPFKGAAFSFLSANILLDPQQVDPAVLSASGWSGGARSAPLVSPTLVKDIAGVKIGFIGLTLRRAASIVRTSSTVGITLTDEIEAANEAVRSLNSAGVHAIVLTIHEGGEPATENYNGCDNLGGSILPIVRGLSADIDVVVSGHTHRGYICTIGRTLVTSAASYGRLITDIDLTIDRRTGDIVGAKAANVVVTRDVDRDPAQVQLLDHYRPVAARLGGEPVGSVTMSVVQRADRTGQSPLGGLVADSMLAATSSADNGGAVVAMVNPGGIRTDLTRRVDGSPVTYADAFDVLPFGNTVIVRTLTGEALTRLLEQQFDNPTAGESRMLQVSKDFSYVYDSSDPAGQRVDRQSITINGKRVNPLERYRIALSDFLWDGGDRLTVAREGTDPVAVGSDVEIFIAYLRAHSPISPGAATRVRRR